MHAETQPDPITGWRGRSIISPAGEASHNDPELDAPATERQVGGTALVAALNATRRGPTVRASRYRGSRPHDQTDPVSADIETIDDETYGDEARRPEAGGACCGSIIDVRNLNAVGISENESEPLFDAD